MKLTLGFTGTKNGMDGHQKRNLSSHFYALMEEYDEIEFHHGDCIGADAQAAQMLDVMRQQFAKLRCKVTIIAHPGYPTRNPEETKWRAFTTCNDETLSAKPFVARDHDIVDISDRMFATPQTPEMEERSGTWLTIRYAIKKKKLTTVLNPAPKVKYDPHALPAKTNAVAGETNLYGPTHRVRGIR